MPLEPRAIPRLQPLGVLYDFRFANKSFEPILFNDSAEPIRNLSTDSVQKFGLDPSQLFNLL